MDFACPWSDPTWTRNTQYLLNSFKHWLGTELIERQGSPQQQAETLFKAPSIVVAHGLQEDPIFFYGNLAALQLWHVDLPSLLEMPSRKTAEPVHRDERARLLKLTQEQGFVDDYQGIRIATTGERFLIERAIVWNVMNDQDQQVGQAATFYHWQRLVDRA